MMIWRQKEPISDEELDWAIRSALQAETEGLEPSPEVWERIRARIECAEYEPGKQPEVRAHTFRQRAAVLVQAAVLVTLVFGVGATFNQQMHQENLSRAPAQYVAQADPGARGLEYPKDALNVGRLDQLAQAPAPGSWRLLP